MVFKGELPVGKIPFLVFWLLNSISLRFFPGHPKSGRNSIFWAILAWQVTCYLLTSYTINTTLSSFFIDRLSRVFYPLEKLILWHFWAFWPWNGPIEQKTAKMWHFDQFSVPVPASRSRPISPTLQALSPQNGPTAIGRFLWFFTLLWLPCEEVNGVVSVIFLTQKRSQIQEFTFYTPPNRLEKPDTG